MRTYSSFATWPARRLIGCSLVLHCSVLARHLVLTVAPVKHWSPLFGVVMLLLPLLAGADVDKEGRQFLETWLARQAQVHSWAADVVQTRKLRSLVRPLEARGRVWVHYPNRFRWQLGDPPRTIAVRSDNELQILYPQLRRVERYPLTDDIDPAWRQVLALLEVGFPSDPKEFYARYELADAQRQSNGWRFELRPVAEETQRLIEGVALEIARQDFTINSTALTFADGSVLRTQFDHQQVNPTLDESLFRVQVPEGFDVIEAPKAMH